MAKLRHQTIVLALVVFLAAGDVNAASPAAPDGDANPVVGTVVQFTAGPASVDITIDQDNPAVRDLLSMLPLTLTLEEVNAREKIGDLPTRLSTAGAPEGVTPETGDMAYFVPWGNLALFYRDFRYSRGLVRLGRIEGDVERLTVDGEIKVRIERVEAAD